MEWQAYYLIDPWGGERGDVQAAIIAQVIAQANAARGRRFKLTDFIPDYLKRFVGIRRQSCESMKAQLKAATMGFHMFKKGK